MKIPEVNFLPRNIPAEREIGKIHLLDCYSRYITLNPESNTPLGLILFLSGFDLLAKPGEKEKVTHLLTALNPVFFSHPSYRKEEPVDEAMGAAAGRRFSMSEVD